MQFSKMHGLGNDFMVVDAVTQNVFFSPELIRRLADRHLGVGFDQLLVVEPPYDPDLDFHYRIFNADGSEVSQCGNGARCFARFVRLKGLTNKRDIRVSTANGRMVLSVTEDDLVRVNMGEPNFEPSQVPFRANKAEKTYIMRAAEQTVLCGVVSMGNPHCVIQVDDVDTAAVETLDLSGSGRWLAGDGIMGESADGDRLRYLVDRLHRLQPGAGAADQYSGSPRRSIPDGGPVYGDLGNRHPQLDLA